MKKVSILGISGGGVYAAACAFQFSEKILKVGLISTINEFNNGRTPKNMSKPNRISFYLAQKLPWLLRFMFAQQKK
ncbi:hypothetical protein [Maribacter halichondriae]|uniref:hypothetical protein n=1 Tax=Maribacter halichondriae TaxID=2980554 RepID=UPI002359E808|nr:hypothetical protein [Maribacter sp. Hal144]